MQKINIQTLLSDWAEKEKKKIEVDKKRRYLHFDARIKSIGHRLINEISNPDYVIGRFFYPFIKDVQITRRYKRNTEGVKFIESKRRPICYASHKDAFIFSWYAYILNYLYEIKIKGLGISNNAIAYRSFLRKNNVHFAKEVFNFIKIKKECVVLCFDIVNFFDSLDHKIVKSVWKNLLIDTDLIENNGLPKDHYAVFKASTKYSFAIKKNIFKFFKIDKKNIKSFSKICEQEDFQKIVRTVGLIQKNNEKKGVPQGIAVSSVLSNAYMIDFDLAVAQYVAGFDGLYRRYSDDIIVVCEKDNYRNTEVFIKEQIAKLKLEIQSEKTEIRLFSIDDQKKINCTDENGKQSKLQYLGIQTDGLEEKFRGKTVAKFYRRIAWRTKREFWLSRKSKNNIAQKRLNKRFAYSENRNFMSYARMAVSLLNSKKLKEQFSVKKIVQIIGRKVKKYKK
ncbi:MAG: reverse transcriptase domain-containing protein [Candidatus Staskawiczbacteria bacterium]|nr:reverse transcriptase domain-containing protein [Candidatus Staskawiczbacteria bacterium]